MEMVCYASLGINILQRALHQYWRPLLRIYYEKELLICSRWESPKLYCRVCRALKGTIPVNPHATYQVVLVNMPKVSSEQSFYKHRKFLTPEGFLIVLRRFTTTWRNNWMVHKSNICVCDVNHLGVGAERCLFTQKRCVRCVN